MDRQGYLGGSDAAAIIGISPFRSRLDVWAEKRGTAEPVVETPSMMLGLYMEPFIRAVHEAATGEKIVSVPQKTHPEHPWMRARLDGKVKGKPVVYEAKTASMPLTGPRRSPATTCLRSSTTSPSPAGVRPGSWP